MHTNRRIFLSAAPLLAAGPLLAAQSSRPGFAPPKSDPVRRHLLRESQAALAQLQSTDPVQQAQALRAFASQLRLFAAHGETIDLNAQWKAAYGQYKARGRQDWARARALSRQADADLLKLGVRAPTSARALVDAIDPEAIAAKYPDIDLTRVVQSAARAFDAAAAHREQPVKVVRFFQDSIAVCISSDGSPCEPWISACDTWSMMSRILTFMVTVMGLWLGSAAWELMLILQIDLFAMYFYGVFAMGC